MRSGPTSRRRVGRPRGRSVWLWVALAVFSIPPARAQTAHGPARSATEEQMRPAFLYQLAQYVTWPAAKAGEPLRFCILGDDQLGDRLGAIVRAKSIQGRPLAVSKVSGPDQFAGCDLALLALDNGRRLRDLLAHWAYPPILLVGEANGFAELGGMVNLAIQEGRLAIEVNLGACRRAGLELRSQLLRVARIVLAAGEKP